MDPLRAELERAADRIAAAVPIARAIIDGRKAGGVRASRRSNMTSKVRGLPDILGQTMDRINDAAEKAVRRLENAHTKALEPIDSIHKAADEIEKNAAESSERINDMLGRTANGGPPLDETTSSTQSEGSAPDVPLP